MQKPVTIKTIAKELGLSVSAVSKALNNYSDINPETKRRVAAKAEELGYSPNILARSLVKKSSNFVGVVIRDVSNVYGEMFRELNDAARRKGLSLVLYDTNRDPELELRCVQTMIDSMAMGIIIVPTGKDVSDIRRMCRGRVPVVYLGSNVTDERDNFITVDAETGSRMAMEHLIGLEHREIAFICDRANTASQRSKIAVYRETMRHLGQKERIYQEADPEGNLVRYGYRQAKSMLAAGGKVTAVFAAKDKIAIGVIQAIREAGFRVPEDISVIGYDGINAAELPMIDLTTVAQPREELAEKIIDILTRHEEDSTAPAEHYWLRPVLIERGSCKKRE